jgi:cytochrome P450
MSVQLKTPPGPPPAKNLFDQIRIVRRLQTDRLGTMGEWRARYGDFFVMQFGRMSQYMTSRPEAIHQITVTEAASFHKNVDYKDEKRGLARFLGNGLVTSDGEFWKRQRKLVAPAFHTNRITNYAQTMVDYTLDMLQGWHDGARLDISHEMTRLTMLIVARSLFHTDASSDVMRVNKAVGVIQRVSGETTLIPPWVPTPRELSARRATRDLDAIIYRMIREWRVTREDKGDLLSMLLLAVDDEGKGMTDKQARDEAVTLFLGGHETTANALNWTWYLLAQHPEIEAKLHEELDAVLAGRAPTLADLESLPYTEMVLKESMRLYPPVWGFGRQAIEDVQLGEYLLPKGTSIGVMTYFTHRDPAFWDEPERFDPERFSPENEKKIPKYAYIPFAAGPRICIGNAFAMMEARLVLATVASRYRLRLAPGQKVEMLPLITLNPKGGLPMRLEAREPVREPERELAL